MSAPAARPRTVPRNRLGGPESLLLTGAAVFVFILWLSAYFDASIRWLHFFQAWMYIVAVVIGLRRNRWGYFIGISAAGFWDYANLFVTTFFKNGLIELARWIETGRLARADQFIAVPAWIGNLLVFSGCLWAYWRLRQRSAADGLRFLAAFAITTGFFALIIAIFQPRYLALFPRLLHPHAPW
jgi:hypothetical protein